MSTFTETHATVTLLRVMQGLRHPNGERPYTVDEVTAAADRLAARASKPLLLTITVSRSALVQTLDHLAELDDDTPPVLESCVCGACTDCPDGWHYGTHVPCGCTPDCALNDDDDEEDA